MTQSTLYRWQTEVCLRMNHPEDDVARCPNNLQLSGEERIAVAKRKAERRSGVVRESKSRQCSLAHDDGMDELNRNVLRIAGRCAGAERNQDTVAGEAARHPVAQVRKTVCIAMKEGMNNLGALGVGLLHQLRPVR